MALCNSNPTSYEDELFSDSEEDISSVDDQLSGTDTGLDNDVNVGSSALSNGEASLDSDDDEKDENNRLIKNSKDYRATVGMVFDRLTEVTLRNVLSNLLELENDYTLTEVMNGCISTGKEAQVYHAMDQYGEEFAIKIYKTSILSFRKQDKYIRVDSRNRKSNRKPNNRKLIQIWAEKEMRNLTRMYNNRIPVPKPLISESNVFAMTFIGKNGFPAPRLKDAKLTKSKARQAYREVVTLMWKMYTRCKLIHADLSEYNMLYFNDQVYIIDVAQSVEPNHPNAMEYLRRDSANITNFFRKYGVATMTNTELFDFITDTYINENNMEECLDMLSQRTCQRTILTLEEEIEEDVGIIRDIRDDTAKNYMYGSSTEVNGELRTVPENGYNENTSDDDEQQREHNSPKQSKFKDSSRPKNETREEKKARKQAVKVQKAEKRNNPGTRKSKKRQEELSDEE